MAYDAYELARDLRKAADSIERYMRRQDEIEEKLRVLKRKRTTIINLKNIFKETMKKDKDIIRSKYKWKGSWYSNDFKRDTDKLMDEEKKYYKKCLDHIHDSINMKILELENEKNRLGDSILYWRRTQREISTRLDNMTN